MHLAVHPIPQSTVNPFARPSPPKKVVNDRERQPEQQITFARNLVNAVVPQLRGAHDHRDYYIVRAEEARLLAETADEQQIKVIHLEMAARYYSLANYQLARPGPMSAVA